MRTLLLLPITLIFTGTALAAQLYGTLWEADRPIPQGVKVTINCSGNSSHTGTTDAGGGYRIYVSEKGKCVLRVEYRGQAPSTDVYSFDDATKYDFDLVQQNGTYELRRR